MKRPPYGLHLPCEIIRVVDGDTVEVSLPESDRLWKIRLLDCWAPEKRTDGGMKAKHYAESIVEKTEGQASVAIQAPNDPTRLLKGLLSFDRILAHVFLDDHGATLSELMVAAGHATKEKP